MPHDSRQNLIAHHFNTERMLLGFAIYFGFAMIENVYQLYISNVSKGPSDNLNVISWKSNCTIGIFLRHLRKISVIRYTILTKIILSKGQFNPFNYGSNVV